MSFFDELKRRNVFRVAIAYAAVAWLLIEVADTLFPSFGVPDSAFRGLVIVLALGFLPALVFSWAYELTPEGLKRERDVAAADTVTHHTARRLNLLTIGVIVLAIGFVAFDRLWLKGRLEPDASAPDPVVATTDGARPSSAATSPATGDAGIARSTDSAESTSPTSSEPTGLPDSIAVLPFANRSANPDDRFFVDGIHDDLLTFISQIGTLKTISRTSVMRYQDSTQSVPEIAAELGVSAILEGGVQRAGDQVRINVQLIDARSDAHLWSQIYDRELTATNIFEIQSEIAGAIAAALRAELSPAEQARIDRVPTDNLEALEAYFVGRQDLAKRTTAGLAAAKADFRRAVELDPGFALAWVGLADATRLYPYYAVLGTDDWDVATAEARAAIDRALAIDPQLGEAYATLGWLIDEEGGTTRSELFDRAARLNPNYAPAYQWHGEWLGRQGKRLDKALALMEKAVSLDPLSAIIINDYGEVLSNAGRFDEALAAFERAIELEPEFAVGYRRIGELQMQVLGRLDEAVLAFEKSFSIEPDRWVTASWLSGLHLNLGNLEATTYWQQRTRALIPDGRAAPVDVLRLLHDGAIEEAAALSREHLRIDPDDATSIIILSNHELTAGRPEEALRWFERMAPEWFGEDAEAPDGWAEMLVTLAAVARESGDQALSERTLRVIDRVIDEHPRMVNRAYEVADARVHALRGDTERALAALRAARDAGWRYSAWFWLEHDWVLRPLHGHPGYQQIRRDIEADLAAQARRLAERRDAGP